MKRSVKNVKSVLARLSLSLISTVATGPAFAGTIKSIDLYVYEELSYGQWFDLSGQEFAVRNVEGSLTVDLVDPYIGGYMGNYFVDMEFNNFNVSSQENDTNHPVWGQPNYSSLFRGDRIPYAQKGAGYNISGVWGEGFSGGPDSEWNGTFDEETLIISGIDCFHGGSGGACYEGFEYTIYASVNPTPVPVPGTALFLLSGFATIGLSSFLKRSNK